MLEIWGREMTGTHSHIHTNHLEYTEISLQIENPLTAYSLQISNTYISSPIIIVITGAAANPSHADVMCVSSCTFTLRHLGSIERCVKSHHVWQIFYQTTILALNALSVRMYVDFEDDDYYQSKTHIVEVALKNGKRDCCCHFLFATDFFLHQQLLHIPRKIEVFHTHTTHSHSHTNIVVHICEP